MDEQNKEKHNRYAKVRYTTNVIDGQTDPKRRQVGWGFWLWWVLASSVALLVGLAEGGAVGRAVFGAITGGVLVWLLRQPVPETKTSN